jgi:hypothetical protein
MHTEIKLSRGGGDRAKKSREGEKGGMGDGWERRVSLGISLKGATREQSAGAVLGMGRLGIGQKGLGAMLLYGAQNTVHTTQNSTQARRKEKGRKGHRGGTGEALGRHRRHYGDIPDPVDAWMHDGLGALCQ